MSRWISLILLLAIIAVTFFVLYKVMATFLLPLFLAAVLVVIFRPVHTWMTENVKGRPATAALLTTTVILLTVLIPLGTIFTMAVREGFGAVGGDVADRAEVQIGRLRSRLGVEIPFARFPEANVQEGVAPLIRLLDLDQAIAELPDQLPPWSTLEEDLTLIDELRVLADQLTSLRARVSAEIERAIDDEDEGDDSAEMKSAKGLLQRHSPEEAVSPLDEIIHTLEQTVAYAELGRAALRPEPSTRADHVGTRVPDPPNGDNVDLERRGDGDRKNGDPTERATVDSDSDPNDLDTSVNASQEEGIEGEDTLEGEADDGVVDGPLTEIQLLRRFGRIKAKYEVFRIDLGGGPVWAWITKMANPGASQLDSLRANLQQYVRGWLPSVAGQATALFGSIVLGLSIMSLAVFYFLKDGPAMIQSIMRLSPLDDRYERELLQEFDSVSRAVVLATLLSAITQGLLAAVAYFLGGFHSVFLLTSLTIVLAMVPFIGAAAIWFPACLWLGFVEERLFAAAVMFLYGFGVISMADNVIKPYVLHGQSKLHPLLALLSVLGGVQALGPIGILVGPMVVSFLQALLNILHHELQQFDHNDSSEMGSISSDLAAPDLAAADIGAVTTIEPTSDEDDPKSS